MYIYLLLLSSHRVPRKHFGFFPSEIQRKGMKKVARTKILTTFFYFIKSSAFIPCNLPYYTSFQYGSLQRIECTPFLFYSWKSLLNSSAVIVFSTRVTLSLSVAPSLTSMQRSMRLSTVSRFLSISLTELSRYSSGMLSIPY